MNCNSQGSSQNLKLILHRWCKISLNHCREPWSFSAELKSGLLAVFLIKSCAWVFHDRSLVSVIPSNFALSTSSLRDTLIGLNIALFLAKEIRSSLHFSSLSWTLLARDHSASLSAIIWGLLTSPFPTTSDAVQYNTIQNSLFNEGDVINGTKYNIKQCKSAIYNLQQEKLKQTNAW